MRKSNSRVFQVYYIKISDSLIELEIVRNCFEKVCHLNTEDLRALGQCKLLKNLTIVYSRNISDDIVEVFEQLPSLEVLNLRYDIFILEIVHFKLISLVLDLYAQT
jgi:hypothetical protein